MLRGSSLDDVTLCCTRIRPQKPNVHVFTALYLSQLPGSALERSTVMSKRWVVDFYELPGGVTEAILRRIRLIVHT